MKPVPGPLSIYARSLQAGAVLALCFASGLALCAPIHDAARKGDQAKVVALLTQNPELVFSRDKFGNTPLHLAALHNQPAVAALLLANGADVNARITNGDSPLTLALQSYQHKEMLELLLTHGAEVNVLLSDGTTPLRRTVDLDLPDEVELLLANGADPDAESPVHDAVRHDRTKILEILLDYGADPNTKDWAGHTPLYYAHEKAAALLRAHGGH
jgi:ankyrin repeat protein